MNATREQAAGIDVDREHTRQPDVNLGVEDTPPGVEEGRGFSCDEGRGSDNHNINGSMVVDGNPKVPSAPSGEPSTRADKEIGKLPQATTAAAAVEGEEELENEIGQNLPSEVTLKSQGGKRRSHPGRVGSMGVNIVRDSDNPRQDTETSVGIRPRASDRRDVAIDRGVHGDIVGDTRAEGIAHAVRIEPVGQVESVVEGDRRAYPSADEDILLSPPMLSRRRSGRTSESVMGLNKDNAAAGPYANKRTTEADLSGGGGSVTRASNLGAHRNIDINTNVQHSEKMRVRALRAMAAREEAEIERDRALELTLEVMWTEPSSGDPPPKIEATRNPATEALVDHLTKRMTDKEKRAFLHACLEDARECTHKPRTRSTAARRVRGAEGSGGGEGGEEAKDGQGAASNRDAFLYRVDAQERAKTAAMEHRRGELAYKAVLDKRVCPGCGAEQSYDEASSSTNQSSPRIPGLRDFLKRVDDFQESKWQALQSANEFKETQMRMMALGVRQYSRDGVLESESEMEERQRLFWEDIEDDFIARLQEDAARRQVSLKSRSAALYQDWTFQPTLTPASQRVVGESAWAGMTFLERMEGDLQRRREATPHQQPGYNNFDFEDNVFDG
eukprot:g8624.t1